MQWQHPTASRMSSLATRGILRLQVLNLHNGKHALSFGGNSLIHWPLWRAPKYPTAGPTTEPDNVWRPSTTCSTKGQNKLPRFVDREKFSQIISTTRHSSTGPQTTDDQSTGPIIGPHNTVKRNIHSTAQFENFREQQQTINKIEITQRINQSINRSIDQSINQPDKD